MEISAKPRCWQTRALEAWKRGGYRGIAKVVTGGGKTIFAFLCADEYLRQFPSGKIVVLVPTLALADQWLTSFIKDAGIDETKIQVFSGVEKHENTGIVNILTLNTARTLLPNLMRPETTFLIVDECHRSGSPENSKVLKHKWLATLGLSATPERDFDESFKTALVPYLGPIVIDYSYQDAYRDGVICRFKLVNIRAPLASHEEAEIKRLTKKAFGYFREAEQGSTSAAELLKKLYIQRARVSARAIARTPFVVRLVEQQTEQRVLIFHEDIDGLTRILTLLRSRGVESVAYHSRIGPSIRRGHLLMYREGVVRVLGCCRALDEGFNVPETNVGIIASSTASNRQRIQRLGRMLRPYPGKEIATVYTLYCTRAEENRLRNEAENLEEIATVEWLRQK